MNAHVRPPVAVGIADAGPAYSELDQMHNRLCDIRNLTDALIMLAPEIAGVEGCEAKIFGTLVDCISKAAEAAEQHREAAADVLHRLAYGDRPPVPATAA